MTQRGSAPLRASGVVVSAETYGRAMPSSLNMFQAVASRQLSLVTRRQMRLAGVSDRQIDTLVKSGVLQRTRPRVFAVAGSSMSWEQALLAVVLAADEDAVASHSSAARLWNLKHRPPERFEITTRRDRRVRLEGIRVHTSDCFDETDIAVQADVPCTSFERTLCDCSTSMTQFELGRALDDGLRRGVASLRRLEACAERLESCPGRHMSVIRKLLRERDNDFDPGGSASELRVLKLVRLAGLPIPVQQHRVRVEGRRFVLDYAWLSPKVFLEYYGLAVHSLPSAVHYDNDRLTLLAGAGWKPVVVTDVDSDDAILRKLATALG